MAEIELGIVQERFADIVWENEPIGSGDLVKICEETLNWKKPTTYTVLRKLCEKGLLKNNNGIVTSIISRNEFYSARSEQIIDEFLRVGRRVHRLADIGGLRPGCQEIEVT